jgi:hypothetical protein
MIKTELEFKSEALQTFLTKGFTIVGDIVTPVDASEEVPSVEDWDAKIAELKAEYDAQLYARTRQGQYPEIGDQLDDLYKKGAFSDEMAAKLKKVKDDNPKPE